MIRPMRYRLILCLCCAALLTGAAGTPFCGAAEAGIFSSLSSSSSSSSSSSGVRKFDYFSVKVPEGWTAQQQGATVVIKSTTSDASLSIAIASRGAASFEEIVNRLCEQMKGKDLTHDDKDGSWNFQYKNTAGIDCVAVLLEIKNDGEKDTGLYVVVAISGYDDEDEKVIDEIMDSMEFNDD